MKQTQQRNRASERTRGESSILDADADALMACVRNGAELAALPQFATEHDVLRRLGDCLAVGINTTC